MYHLFSAQHAFLERLGAVARRLLGPLVAEVGVEESLLRRRDELEVVHDIDVQRVDALRERLELERCAVIRLAC